mgnify:FL=1|tara:strand:- start:7065 stop:7217 length:153 start_codon:yes stop_codon:yes gene_type:complete
MAKVNQKAKNSRVIAIDADIHHILRVYAAQNDKGIAEVASKAILHYISNN